MWRYGHHFLGDLIHIGLCVAKYLYVYGIYMHGIYLCTHMW